MNRSLLSRAMAPVLLSLSAFLCLTTLSHELLAQRRPQADEPKLATKTEDKPSAAPFAQLDDLLPTPSATRTASGAPGHGYWQQKVDYRIDVTIDDERQYLTGKEGIRYHNRSPDTLRYLWLQLDANRKTPNSDSNTSRTAPDLGRLGYGRLRSILVAREFDGGVKIESVRDKDGRDLSYTIVKTMMRVDLAAPLLPGKSTELRIDWGYKINRKEEARGRSMCEWFEKDKNFIYEIAQWYPRLCVYNDVRGWQNKQFLGRGEFALEFGNYEVHITVPEDHIVASTGVLQNPDEVLSETQRARLRKAESSKKPLFIVTPEEALANQNSRAKGSKTWVFRAEKVRDFSFATSRKFIWDAVKHKVGENRPWCMSYYPNEAEPLWSRYSTHAVMHTLDVYSKFTFDYPYPVAISVNGPVGGMEYPMICFNGPRPEEDGTYSKRSKYGLISVVIHEVGHNWFPMIVNSDERQWTWMDEGLNTFCQYLAEQLWEDHYPSWRGEPHRITDYMKDPRQVPIMTNSESLLQFGNNAYGKPATALNVLRESILGRELFDFAFKEYARRWAFKHPEPADLFRTLEDASGIDLDWFWRGWFFSSNHVDIAIRDVREFTIDTRNPDIEKALAKKERDARPETLAEERNKKITKRTDRFPELLDFYNRFDELDVTEHDRKEFEDLRKRLDSDDRALLGKKLYFNVVELENLGGLVMPLALEVQFRDKTKKLFRVPVEIWRSNDKKITKLLLTERPIVAVRLDPRLETADTDLANNVFPQELRKSRFQLFKEDWKRKNPMQKAGLGNRAVGAKGKKAKQGQAKEASSAGKGGSGNDGR